VSNSAANVYELINVAQNDINNIAAVEYPAAALTLTRSSTLAITTAATQITWQIETRNYGFTWSGTTVTIPTNGYYLISFYCALLVNTTLSVILVANGSTRHNVYTSVPATTGNGYAFGAMFSLYFNTDDTFSIFVIPGVNTTIRLNAENVAAPSPFLHVVQLTGSVEE